MIDENLAKIIQDNNIDIHSSPTIDFPYDASCLIPFVGELEIFIMKQLMINNNWAWVLRKYSLKELRRRQDICNQQIAIAHKTKNTEALERCQAMADTLCSVILEKTK